MMQAKWHVIWRLMRFFLLVLLFVSLMLITWLLSTKDGTQRVAMMANHHLTALQLNDVGGTLFGDLSVGYLQWREDLVVVSAYNVKLNWNPACLLDANICLKTLNAERVVINVLPAAEQGESDEGLPSIVMPVGIIADRVDIQTLALTISGQTHKIEGLQFSGRWVDSVLTLSDVTAGYQGLSLNGVGNMDFSLPWRSQFKGRARYGLPERVSQQPLQFDFALQGTQLAFDITGDLSGDWPATLSSSVSFDDARFPLTIKLESPTSWKIPLGRDQTALSTTLNIRQFTANASLNDLTVHIQSTLKTAFWRELDASIEAQWLGERLKIKQMKLDSDDGQMQLQGEFISSPTQSFDVSVSTRNMALHTAILPASKPARPLLPYSVVLNSDWHITGHAEEGTPHIDVNLTQLTGHINQHPIAAEAVFSYGHNDDYRYEGAMWRVDQLMVSSGANQINARGGLNADGDRFKNVEVHFLLPEPQQWLPDLSGSLEGSIRVDGSIDQLDLHGQLTTEMLTYGDMSAASIEAVFDIAQSGMTESSLTLSAENISIDGTKIASTDWQLKGDRKGSEVQADVALHNMGRASTECHLSWDAAIQNMGATRAPKGIIESECSAFEWQSEVFPYALFTPHNTQPILINWDIDDASLTVKPFCLADGDIELCSHQDALWDPITGYSFSLTADKLPLQPLIDRWNAKAEEDNRLDNVTFQGDLNGVANISQRPGRTVNAELALNMTTIELWLGARGNTVQERINTVQNSYTKSPLSDNDMAPLHISFVPFMLTSTMRDENITLNAHFSSPQLGETKTRMTLTDTAKRRLIDGDLSLSKLNLSFLQNVLPSVENLSGLLSSQLNFSGSLSKPEVSGRFNLTDGGLESGYLPETLDNIAIEGVFDQQQLNYQGVFSSVGGQANLKGTLHWQDDWVLNTSLNSEAFHLTPRSGVNLTVKPNLSLRLKEGFADISGTLEIPHARIILDALPEGAKTVSADTRIIGDENIKTDAPWTYQTNIKLVLGDDVHFRGFGVNTYLTGRLLLTQQPGRELVGKGEINTDDGFYTIFGQRLTIKEARFLFNGPLERPDLQLDATRAIASSSVNVGVKVTGPADEPEVTFYSQPAMNETSVIHYLLTGRAPEKSSNNADLLNNMMLSAGIFGSAELTEKWANKVGITDLQISTQSDDEGTSVEVGGYLSPDIYLKYGASLYDEAKTVAMRYRLHPNLFIEAAGGFNSSLDIIYSFEHQ